jgi:hypothetical protein
VVQFSGSTIEIPTEGKIPGDLVVVDFPIALVVFHLPKIALVALVFSACGKEGLQFVLMLMAGLLNFRREGDRGFNNNHTLFPRLVALPAQTPADGPDSVKKVRQGQRAKRRRRRGIGFRRHGRRSFARRFCALKRRRHRPRFGLKG